MDVGLVEGLSQETTCPICLDYFKDPVIIPECGHNFCKVCLDQCCDGGTAKRGTCPHCRKTFRRGNVGPNRQLANVVEIARKLSLREAERKERVCERHQKPKHLFCRVDRIPICVTCERNDHKDHQTLLLEEAAQEYTGQISNRLEMFKEEKEKMLKRKGKKEKEGQDLLEQIKAEREKTLKTFIQLHQFLDKQENSLLAQMEDTAKEIERVTGDHLEKLSKELQSLDLIIQEMEEKLQQSAPVLLQDIEKFMESHEEAQTSEDSRVTLSTEFEWRILAFRDFSSFLKTAEEAFKELLISSLPHQKVNVHLDPDTAHPMLVVSADCKSVRWTQAPQNVPDNPVRFDKYAFVLGREGLTAGKHFWEVCLGPEGWWSVGVARKTVKRKSVVKWGAEEGIWCLGKWGSGYWVTDMDTPLSLGEEPKKIRVTLNCEGGHVAFYDAERGTLIYECQRSVFAGKLHPIFYATRKTHLSLTS